MLAEVAGNDIADGVEVSAAVVGDDALGIACRTRSVAQRNRVPFVAGQAGREAGVALRHCRFIFEFADPLAAGKGRIVDVDHEWFWPFHQRQRF